MKRRVCCWRMCEESLPSNLKYCLPLLHWNFCTAEQLLAALPVSTLALSIELGGELDGEREGGQGGFVHEGGWISHWTEPDKYLNVCFAHLLQHLLQLIEVHEILRKDDQLLFALLTAVQDVLHCPCLCGCSLAQSSPLVCQIICHCQQLLHSLCSMQTAVRCQSQTYRIIFLFPGLEPAEFAARLMPWLQ